MPRISDPQPLLLDTHVWLWLEAGSEELPAAARSAISVSLGLGMLRVAAISLWELALLAARERVALGKPTEQWLQAALAEPGPVVEPLSLQVAVESAELPGVFHRDPADRMIVATARVTNARLMTRDRRMLDYAAQGRVAAVAV